MHKAVLIAFCLLVGVFAHYEVEYPPSRGFEESTEADAPCGSFDTPGSTRTTVPATFNVVANIYDGSGTIDVYYTEGSKSENFTIIKSAVPIPDTGLINVTVTMPEEYVGTSGIIQVVFNSDETFYQCSDVNVVQDTNSASGVVTAMTLLSVLIALLL